MQEHAEFPDARRCRWLFLVVGDIFVIGLGFWRAPGGKIDSKLTSLPHNAMMSWVSVTRLLPFLLFAVALGLVQSIVDTEPILPTWEELGDRRKHWNVQLLQRNCWLSKQELTESTEYITWRQPGQYTKQLSRGVQPLRHIRRSKLLEIIILQLAEFKNRL